MHSSPTLLACIHHPPLPRRYSQRLYVAYTTFWVVGSLLAMQVCTCWPPKHTLATGAPGQSTHIHSKAQRSSTYRSSMSVVASEHTRLPMRPAMLPPLWQAAPRMHTLHDHSACCPVCLLYRPGSLHWLQPCHVGRAAVVQCCLPGATGRQLKCLHVYQQSYYSLSLRIHILILCV